MVETKSEREARGHPVGYDVPYSAMGGLTGFSSLAEGYMRLDDSGIGAPSKEFLEKPIGIRAFICINIATLRLLVTAYDHILVSVRTVILL